MAKLMTFIAYKIVKKKEKCGLYSPRPGYDRASYTSPIPQVDRAHISTYNV